MNRGFDETERHARETYITTVAFIKVIPKRWQHKSDLPEGNSSLWCHFKIFCLQILVSCLLYGIFYLQPSILNILIPL